MKNYKELTKAFKALDLQDLSLEIRISGTICIMLAGIMPFFEQILEALNIESSMTFGFTNFSNFIWAFSQCLSPILLIIGFLLRPYFISFLLPVYCYSIQMLWIFNTNMYLDDPLLHLYAIGSCAIFIFIAFIILKLKERNREKIENDRLFIKEMEESIALITEKLS